MKERFYKIFVLNPYLEALLGGFSHPLTLKFQGQLSLIPKIIETVIPKITYLWNMTIGGNFKELGYPFTQ